MKDNSKMIEKVVSEIEASSKRYQTEAGPPEKEENQSDRIDAVNQIFALFRLNYHNQYYSAFGDNPNYENLAKKLWLDTLDNFSSETIYLAARNVITESEYLPTLNKMITECRKLVFLPGLPDPRQAYLEACNKNSPKIRQTWSHAIVYLAGKDCGWFFLANTPEYQALTEFKKIYTKYCNGLQAGETYTITRERSKTDLKSQSPDKSVAKEYLTSIKKLFD
ncbi:MAG: hypothetical protein CBC09_00900 [Cellvibrionales bacterium TMED49]|nr:hypothetical protein [Porticoccaceae bacterium]OUU40103.1 MAG: hypothetical protein CBC09_00900 [Cellvibrionales bacterium TMED49]